MWKVDNDPIPDPKERGSMRVKVLGDNCVPEYLLLQVTSPPPTPIMDAVISSSCVRIIVRIFFLPLIE